MKQRIHYVDVAKGILISLVVLGHISAYSLGDHSRLFYFIYSFHMPCWFFFSGFFYKAKQSNLYFSSKLKTLLLPYLIFSIFNMFIEGFAISIDKEKIYALFRFGGLWFLITLFSISVIYYVLENACFRNLDRNKRTILLSVVSLLFLIVGLTVGGGNVGTHDTKTCIFVNFFFFHVGACLGDVKEGFSTNKPVKRCFLGIIGFLILITLFYIAPLNPSPVDVNINRYGNKLMFVAFAIIGIAGMLLLSSGIQENGVIEYLGRNSLVILLSHFPIWRVANYICAYYQICSYTRLILVFIVTMSTSLVAVHIINKYIPELKGEFRYSNG